MKIGEVIGWGITAAAAAIGIYAAVGARAMMNICYRIVKYRVTNITSKFVYMDIVVAINNPSHFNLRINDYRIDVYLNGKKIVGVGDGQRRIIKAEGASAIPIPLEIDYWKSLGIVGGQELISNLSAGRFEKIIVSLKGEISGEVAKIPVNVPIDQSWSLAQIEKIMREPSTPCKT